MLENPLRLSPIASTSSQAYRQCLHLYHLIWVVFAVSANTYLQVFNHLLSFLNIFNIKNRRCVARVKHNEKGDKFSN